MPVAWWRRKNRLAYIRKSRGFTQEEIARQLAVTTRTVSNWESDTTLPTQDQVHKLAQLLGVAVRALFPREDFRYRAGR